MMFYVYVLSSQVRNYLYVGLTGDISRRFLEHNNGRGRSTKPYKPFKLIHLEKFQTRIDARNREKYLKSGAGKEWIKNNCLGNNISI